MPVWITPTDPIEDKEPMNADSENVDYVKSKSALFRPPKAKANPPKLSQSSDASLSD